MEDWSAEKGLYIGTIEGGQVLPLDWKIHFVKAGQYSLSIIAIQPDREIPVVSRLTHFTVAPKINLNPGQVLPVALGTPLIITLVLFALNYRRRVQIH